MTCPADVAVRPGEQADDAFEPRSALLFWLPAWHWAPMRSRAYRWNSRDDG